MHLSQHTCYLQVHGPKPGNLMGRLVPTKRGGSINLCPGFSGFQNKMGQRVRGRVSPSRAICRLTWIRGTNTCRLAPSSQASSQNNKDFPSPKEQQMETTVQAKDFISPLTVHHRISVFIYIIEFLTDLRISPLSLYYPFLFHSTLPKA